ncbi:MAG: type II toxin-antitoxin system VapC family toxin [Herpetosiphonaceae bacterium]|nr:type II toxin-antitoxin system VapC family toxin [Herpetosiphonaceae bacterium]
MTAPLAIFIDTNILVYASLPESPWHDVAQTTLRRIESEQRLCCISNQVIREYYTTLTRADAQGRLPDRHLVLANIRAMETRWTILSDTADVRKELLVLADVLPIGGRQIHDANLVATMLAYGIPELLTNNPGHFQRFTDRITVQSLERPSDD